jgi:hypothetical protein
VKKYVFKLAYHPFGTFSLAALAFPLFGISFPPDIDGWAMA